MDQMTHTERKDKIIEDTPSILIPEIEYIDPMNFTPFVVTIVSRFSFVIRQDFFIFDQFI